MKNFLYILFLIFMFSNVYAQTSNENITGESFMSVKGTAISSIGHFKDSWDKGSAVYLSYGTVSSNHWALIFQTGFINFNHNADLNFSGDPKFTIIPLQVGGRYYILLDKFKPFILAMNGLNIIKQDFTLDGKKVDITYGKYNFQVGAGFSIRLISSLELEIVGTYNSHLLDSSVPFNITGLEFGGGLNWNLK